MTINIPHADYNVIYAKLNSILIGIAYDNSDFICSRCLNTKEKLLDLADYILGAEAAEYLEEDYEEAASFDEWLEENK